MLNRKEICLFAAVVHSNRGVLIIIYHQYAYVPEQGTSIHWKIQLEFYGNIVNDRSERLGGQQSLSLPCGTIIPLVIQGGLAYMEQQKPTTNDWEDLDTVVSTSPTEWDQTQWDSNTTSEEYACVLDHNVTPALR